MAMLTRQAVYPFWMQVPAQYGAWAMYNPVGPLLASRFSCDAEPVTVGYFSGITATPTLGNLTITPGNFTAASFVSPAMGQPIMGIDSITDNQPWFWVPNGMIAIMTVAYAGTASSAYAEMNVWTAPGESNTIAITNAVHNAVASFAYAVYTPTAGTWVRPALFQVAGASQMNNVQFAVVGGATYTPGQPAVAVSGSTTPMLMPVAKASEFANSVLPFSSTRVTASSVLFTNTTKALNKEGTVLWGRIDPQQMSPFAVTSTTVASLHPAEKAFLPLEEGTYTYTMPSTDLVDFNDFTYRTGITTTGLSQSAPVYRLDNKGLVNVAFFNDPDGGTNLALNVDWHLEFRTTSALFQLGMSTLPVESLHQAQIALLDTGFFFQNWDHKSLLNKMLRALKPFHEVVKGAGPYGYAAVKAAKAFEKATRPAPHTPAATTLAVTTKEKRKEKRDKKKKKPDKTGRK